jgi:hypothetical protein
LITSDKFGGNGEASGTRIVSSAHKPKYLTKSLERLVPNGTNKKNVNSISAIIKSSG